MKDFFEEFLNEQLENPEFRKAWEDSRKEYLIARQIIHLRKQRGITQQELARRLNTTQSNISRIEKGSQNVSLSYLDKIAKALGAEVEVRFKIKDGRAIGQRRKVNLLRDLKKKEKNAINKEPDLAEIKTKMKKE